VRILGIGNARSVIFLRWAWRLAEEGHTVFVVSDRFSEHAHELDGLETFDIRELERLTSVRGLRRVRFAGALNRFVRRFNVDLVHGHYLLPYGYWTSLIEGVPRVVSPWGTDILVDAQRPGQDRRRARQAITGSDWLVVNSNASRAHALKLGADAKRIDQIIWYANLERFGPQRFDPDLRARLGWPSDAVIMLSLRNFRPDTNVDVIVRAFQRVFSIEPRARLLLAARGGPLQAEIEGLVDRLDLAPAVSFLSVGEDDLPKLVASADVLVAMTRSDSTPASLLEAMASGLPAVCADAASVDEWLEPNKGGIIVPQRDEDTLASAMAELIRNRDLRRRYGEHNRRLLAKRFNAPGPHLDRLYRRLVATAGDVGFSGYSAVAGASDRRRLGESALASARQSLRRPRFVS
jgi:glycosyltransferase involved in cell wall biosynthesis